MKKRLLVFHPAVAPYRIDLFNELNDEFDSNFYFFRKGLLSQKFDEKSLESQLNFKPRFLTSGFDFSSRKRMIRFGYLQKIIRHKPNIIICCEFGLITFITTLFTRIFFQKTKVYTICDDSLDIAKNSPIYRRIGRSLCFLFLDGIILGNDFAEKWYNEKFPKMRTVISPIIQKESRILSFANECEAIAKNYLKDFKLEKNILLFVGRFVSVKNLDFLIEVFSDYVKKNKNVVLVLVGEGKRKSELQALVERLELKDDVIFPGRFENEALYAWYRVADYFILPSTSEAFGAVVNESLVVGLPVLCSNLAGASCLINERNGRTFNPYRKEELLTVFDEVLGTSRKLKDDISINNSLMPYTFMERIKDVKAFLNCE